MNLLGGSKSKITKNKNGKNMSRSEIAKMVLVHCKIVNNNYEQKSRVLYTFAVNKLLVIY